MGDPPTGPLVASDDPVAVAATEAVQTGDLRALDQLLAEHPWLATARLGDADCFRYLLHAATDWPGHFPNGPAVVERLVRAGADVNTPSRFDHHTETPLHWAASSNDIAVLDALLDAGADIDAPGAVLGGGAPLADACGFGNWDAARRLVERGACTRLKDAAALGLLDRVTSFFTGPGVAPVGEDTGPAGAPSSEEVTQAFWSACHGGHQPCAAFLLERGADLNWIGWDGMTPLDVAKREAPGVLVEWLRSRGGRRASLTQIIEAGPPSTSIV